MPQIQRSKLFVTPASRGFAMAAEIEELLPGSESNGVLCLTSGIQRSASQCPMFSGDFFHQNRQLLSDIAALAASIINRWVQAYYGVVPLILADTAYLRAPAKFPSTFTYFGLRRRPKQTGKPLG